MLPKSPSVPADRQWPPHTPRRSPASHTPDRGSRFSLPDYVAAAERHRLAQDLHDTVTQTIFSASLIADSLPDVLARQPEAGYRGLAELRQLTHRALVEIRTLLLDLHAEIQTAASLNDLLGQLTQEMSNQAHIPIQLIVEGSCELPPDVRITLYRVTQEALRNVAKHAQARHVSVRLRCHPDRLVLRIADDGCGCNPRSAPPGHLGMDIMRERVRRIAATSRIVSQPGHGTQVIVRWRAAQPQEEVIQWLSSPPRGS